MSRNDGEQLGPDRRRVRVHPRRLVATPLGEGRGLGSGNEIFETLAARLGSARAAVETMMAVALAPDDHPVDRREISPDIASKPTGGASSAANGE